MIKVIDLVKEYPSTKALRGLNLEIGNGEFISIMGKSGSGKTTLLNCMSAILNPTSGQVIFNGVSLFDLNASKRTKIRRESMGFIFQFFNLIPEMTVKENILLPLKINRIKNDEVYYEYLVNKLGLVEFADRYPNTLSGGQQQRVAIARALIHKPKIIFADEPTGNLDEESSKEVLSLLLELKEDLKNTLILVTHDPSTAKNAERVVYIKDGIVSKQTTF